LIESRLIKRAIALGIPLLVLALIWAVLVTPILEAFSLADRDIEARRHLLGKLTGALTRVGYSQERISDAVAKLDMSELLPPAPDAVMSASLQSRIAERAREHGLQAQTMQMLPARANSGIKWIGLGVTLSGPAENIAGLLAAIEASKPYFFIERLALSSQGSPAASDGPPPLLTADFEVYGAVLQDRAQ
jgi:hypothetical protein